MNLFADIRELVVAELEALMAGGALPKGLDLSAVAVEPPRDQGHGDMATNAAMVLAKPAGMQPRAIAEALASRLMADPRIAGADVAGPGFLNLRLQPLAWQGLVREILVDGVGYGRSSLGQGRKVNVEFVSANPTGPMHVGHVRGAVVGDALSRLLAFAGWEVTREYYINDGGAQVDVLARSAYERYREANGLEPEIREGLYPGDYLIPVGEALKAKYGDSLFDKGESVLAGRGPGFRDRDDDGDDPRGSRGAWRARWMSIPRKRRFTARARSKRRSQTLREAGPDLRRHP